jgi:SAM-dependent methyltransferase
MSRPEERRLPRGPRRQLSWDTRPGELPIRVFSVRGHPAWLSASPGCRVRQWRIHLRPSSRRNPRGRRHGSRQTCIDRCKSHAGAGDITYVLGDVLTSELEPASFSAVCAVASLHHMDAGSGLVRLRDLVAPGGVLVVVGLARPDLPKDIPIEVMAQLVSRIRLRANKIDEAVQAPTIWPPPERYATMRGLAAELLPGVRWRRHLLWRYSLVWRNKD